MNNDRDIKEGERRQKCIFKIVRCFGAVGGYTAASEVGNTELLILGSVDCHC